MPPSHTTLPPIPRPGPGALCAVSLIDRRTGRPQQINGAPLLVFTRSPETAARDLLRGRDSAIWEARIESVGKGASL